MHNQERKLNLGCGTVPLPGYFNLDIAQGVDARKLEGVPDASVDEVRASHLLEHFPATQTADVIKDWVRVLKPGGTLRISVPDFDKVVKAYESDQAAQIPVEAMLMGGHADANDVHHVIFNRRKLETILRTAGLIRVESWTGEGDTSAHPVSLNLQGRKPIPRAEPPAVFFVLSCPRLGFSDMWVSMVEALKAVPRSTMRKVTGAYWGQCLERGMSDVLGLGADYVVALDYDTILTADDVRELIYLAESYPEADALIPLQSARGWSSPLVSINDDSGKIRSKFDPAEFANPVTPCSTGHFGCTLIRAEALRQFPHPWFLGQPNADGEWRDGKVDDDIYFWKRWNETGRKAYLANRVVIGHCELMVKWPGKDWLTIHQQLSNYNEKGKPAEVWE